MRQDGKRPLSWRGCSLIANDLNKRETGLGAGLSLIVAKEVVIWCVEFFSLW
jgi:hypothetical protein